ncbi:hypothetical protein [Calothrix sp. UHCC 0171]|uniref:hypothetical protein n=1 Tax=Calothrix sp. UHCC 0171 TaxID=3110245 RepID=UPI002B1FF5F7|nr:hypothetical protein [Calothrix sp. UHCC 0171]MEA5570386.1 hypothetical protein [Calothrix sp. UHCC 0171]
MIRVIAICLLMVFLSACNSNPLTPTNGLVKKAVTLQVEQTQQQLSQQLDLNVKSFEIKHLAISEQKYQIIQTLPAYHIRGTYDLTLKLPKRQLNQAKKPFDVYMQLQKEGKTWRLLQSEKVSGELEPIWRSYLIQ